MEGWVKVNEGEAEGVSGSAKTTTKGDGVEVVKWKKKGILFSLQFLHGQFSLLIWMPNRQTVIQQSKCASSVTMR